MYMSSEHTHKKFEVNRTKIKGGCQSERKVSQMKSYSKMPLPYITEISFEKRIYACFLNEIAVCLVSSNLT